MARFVLNSSSLFLYGTADNTVVVLDAGSDLNVQICPTLEWKTVASVTAAAVNRRTATKHYNALEVFGAAIEGVTLEKLSASLYDSQFLVNREGYQVQYYNGDGSKALAIRSSKLAKMNNMFGWWRYGVKPEITTVWNRYESRGGKGAAAVVDFEGLEARGKRLAAELEEERRKLRDCERREAEKDEIVKHYKMVLDECRGLMKQKNQVVEEKESSLNWLKEVLAEKNRVIEEQRKVIEGQGKVMGFWKN